MESIVSTQFDGQTRTLFKVKCAYCKKPLWLPKHVIAGHSRNFCSPKCQMALRHQHGSVRVRCAHCRKPFHQKKSHRTKSGYTFCSRSCKDIAQRIGGIREVQPPNYKDGRSAYRARALRHYGPKCQRCGYDKDERMLDAHHKDGNRQNNAIKNLEVACVWCHALDTRAVEPHAWSGNFLGS